MKRTQKAHSAGALFPLILILMSAITLQAQNKENGFLFDDFTDAVIHFGGRVISNETINYNLLNNTLYFIDKEDGVVKSVPNIDDINSLLVGERRFTVDRTGITEVLPTTPPIYVQYKARGRVKAPKSGYGGSSEISSTQSYAELGHGDAYARLQGLEFQVFNFYNHYWIEKDGKKRKFTGFKQFLKLYKDHKDSLEKYIKEKHVDFEDVNAIVALCLYAENLQQ